MVCCKFTTGHTGQMVAWHRLRCHLLLVLPRVMCLATKVPVLQCFTFFLLRKGKSHFSSR